MTICPACDTKLAIVPGRGRPRKYCDEACRSRYRRSLARSWGGFPQEFPDRLALGRHWVRADGKRPIRPDGSAASSTDPSTWSEFCEVQFGAGDGCGVMLGAGLGCYDLDGVSDEQIREFVASVREPIVFVERSMSGKGAHVFIEAPEVAGWKRTIDGMKVERYTQARFIRVTGKRFTI